MGHSDWRVSPRPTFPGKTLCASSPPHYEPPAPNSPRATLPRHGCSLRSRTCPVRRRRRCRDAASPAACTPCSLGARSPQHAVAADGDRQAAGDFERLLLRLARGGGAGADGCGPAPRPPARGGRSSSGATSSKARAARRTVSRCHPKHPGGVVVQRDSLPPCCDPCSKAAVRALPFPHHPSAPQLHRVRRHTATTFLPAAQPRIRDLRTGRAFLPSV